MAVVVTELSERILTVTVNRPEKLNALNAEVVEALRAAFHEAKSNAGVGAVIVTGAGEKAFWRVTSPDSRRSRTERWAFPEAVVLDLLERLGKPSIAAVTARPRRGVRLDGLHPPRGLEDGEARTAGSEPRPDPRLWRDAEAAASRGKGASPGADPDRDPVPAEEAWRIGLVNRVVEPAELKAACRELAKKILSRAPLAVRRALEAVNEGLELPFDAAEKYEAALFGLCAATQDWQEGVAAFLTRRPAAFTGR
jgi:enoyl-CoA hydratase